MMNRGQFAQLLAPGFQALYFEEAEQIPVEYPEYCTLETTNRAFETYQEFGGIGRVRLKPEGKPIEYDELVQGGSKQTKPDAYALGLALTHEMIEDAQYNVFKDLPGMLMKSMRYEMDMVAANPLNSGFTTATTIDGVSFFNTAHPLLRGGTQANRLAGDPGLSVQSLQDMMVLAETFLNEEGRISPMTPTDLWVHPTKQWLAKKILQTQFDVGTGNNDINTVAGLVTPHVLHFLTSQTAWFLSTKNYNKLMFITREKPSTSTFGDDRTKGTNHSIYARFTADIIKYQGWFGSTG